jgi:hypothetical protein
MKTNTFENFFFHEKEKLLSGSLRAVRWKCEAAAVLRGCRGNFFR